MLLHTYIGNKNLQCVYNVYKYNKRLFRRFYYKSAVSNDAVGEGEEEFFSAFFVVVVVRRSEKTKRPVVAAAAASERRNPMTGKKNSKENVK